MAPSTATDVFAIYRHLHPDKKPVDDISINAVAAISPENRFGSSDPRSGAALR